ncbi:LAMI_0E04698g1_1 [Lachancea mirantina]|uniref:LAMI_0E04698g1_1 n=1 Tax=Lachancea mirantina TaxID=1230905 RepID=A0A1G4JKT3_9SACH|nr:LAMI_0E04698g1_1 [Lachancea mirantina]
MRSSITPQRRRMPPRQAWSCRYREMSIEDDPEWINDDMDYGELLEDSSASSIQMESDGDDEDGTVCSDERGDQPEFYSQMADFYGQAKHLKMDEQFCEARKTFNSVRELALNANEPLWAFKAQKQVVKCAIGEFTLDSAAQSILSNELLALLPPDVILTLPAEYLQKSLTKIIDRIAPPIAGCFLFDRCPEVDLEKLRSRLSLLDGLNPCVSLLEPLSTHLQLRICELQLWVVRLTENSIDLPALDKLEANCGADVRALETMLQSFMWLYFYREQIDTHRWSLRLSKLRAILSTTLVLSQSMSLTALMHFSEAIVQLHNSQLVCTVRHLNVCKDGFWKCFRDLEHAGLSITKAKSTFRDLTLSCFVISCTLLLPHTENAQEDNISPFEYEAVQLTENATLLANLREIYDSFIKGDLKKYASILPIIAVDRLPLKLLILKMHESFRLRRLWQFIAPVYSCLSLADLQKELYIPSEPCLSQSDIIKLLMRSIMNNTAKVYFKLDLKQRFVFFGETYKVRFSALTKRQSLAKKAQELSIFDKYSSPQLAWPGANATRETQPETCNALEHHQEWLENVGIFREPSQADNKNKTCLQFINELQSLKGEGIPTCKTSAQDSVLKYYEFLEVLSQQF